MQLQKFKKIEKKCNPYMLPFLPMGWNYMQLGNSGDFINGLNKEKEDYGHGCLHVNIDNIFENFCIDTNILGKVNANEDEIKRYSLKKGDICILRSSVKPEGVGYPALFNTDIKPVVFSGFIIRFRPDFSIWDSKFLTYMLRSVFLRNHVIAFASVSANTNINQESLKKIFVPLPSLKEQQKIASILSNIDEAIQKMEQIIEQTQKLNKGLIQRLLTKGIGHTKFKKIKNNFGKFIEVPEEWELKQLGEVVTFRQGLQIAKVQRYKEPGKNRLKLIKVLNFNKEKEVNNDEYIDIPPSSRQSVICNKDDIIIARTGTLGLVLTNIKGIFHNNTFALDYDRKILRKMFFYYYLQSQRVQQFIKIISTRTSQSDLTHKEFSKLIVFIPSKTEQEKIENLIFNINNLLEKQKEVKKYFIIIKKGLMQNLLTGKIRAKV